MANFGAPERTVKPPTESVSVFCLQPTGARPRDEMKPLERQANRRRVEPYPAVTRVDREPEDLDEAA